MREITNEAVRAALDDCLSGVQALPSVRADVLNQVRGDVKVKKKLSVGIIFALLLTLLMAGAAVAAGLGLFGQIGERLDSDARLPALERVSDAVGAAFEAEDGVTVTIDQAYYDGARVNGRLTYRICFRLDDLSQELKLAPVYGESGVHTDEAIVLKTAE